MWWCCGKPKKEAPGCKYGKHVSNEDEDDFEGGQDKDEKEKNKSKKMKCQVKKYKL